MAFAEARSPLSSLLQNPGLAVPATAKSVCLGATVLGFHSALGTKTSSSSARDSSLIGPFSKELAREGSDFLGPSGGVLCVCLSESSNKSSGQKGAPKDDEVFLCSLCGPIFLLYIYMYVLMFVCVLPRVRGQLMRMSSLPLPGGFQGWNSDPQPAEPACWTTDSFLVTFVVG